MSEQNSISAIEARLAAVEQKLSDAQSEKEVSLHFKIEGGEVFIKGNQMQKSSVTTYSFNSPTVNSEAISEITNSIIENAIHTDSRLP